MTGSGSGYNRDCTPEVAPADSGNASSSSGYADACRVQTTQYDPDTGCQIPAASISYDGSQSGIDCAHVQCAIDKLATEGVSGVPGLSPYIDGTNGNWFSDTNNDGNYDDTGVHAQGDQGIPGNNGLDGSDGATGPTGPDGPQGVKGDTGSNGSTGPAGPSTPSADAGNLLETGTDSLLLLPPASVSLPGHVHTLGVDVSGEGEMAYVNNPAADQGYVRKGTAWVAEASVNTGVKNLLINPYQKVNQRGFTGDWATKALGDYGYDRWQKRSETHVQQRVLNPSIINGKLYTFSHNGSGNGAVIDSNGAITTGPASGFEVAIQTAGTEDVIVYCPMDATIWQLELGRVATDFELRPPALEKTLCEYYYQRLGDLPLFQYAASTANKNNAMSFHKSMQRVPTMNGTANNYGSLGGGWGETLYGIKPVTYDATDNAYIGNITADAEMY